MPENLVRVIDANRKYLAEWLPWVETTSNSDDVRREFIRRTRQQFADNDGFQAAIIDGDEIIGVVGFHGIDWMNRSTSIGYWLAADRQGRGTMTEAVKALTRHAFEVWSLNRVEIRVATTNLRSAAIPKRLGFTEEGVLRQANGTETRFRTSPFTRCSCRIGRRSKRRISHQASDMEQRVKRPGSAWRVCDSARAADGPGQRRWVRLIFAGRDGSTGNRRELPRSSVAGHRPEPVPHRGFEGPPCGRAHPLLEPSARSRS